MIFSRIVSGGTGKVVRPLKWPDHFERKKYLSLLKTSINIRPAMIYTANNIHYIPLSDKFQIGIERHHTTLRLILLDNQAELACRKETSVNLKKWIRSDQPSLFKGRLQLHRNEHSIIIHYKKMPTGQIDAHDFLQRIEAISK